jgi:two-component system, HptB-dependent secretion and biofilm response regulator
MENTIKILVVDDIPANRKLLHKMLEVIIDCEIIEAQCGSEAIEICSVSMPDLILMDINMPNVDGYQATVAIKEIMGDRYMPIIFVTALSEDSSLSRALGSGGDDFISKPFNARVLESKINAHLRIRELNNQLSEKNKKLIYEQCLIEHFFESALEKSYLDEQMIKFHMSSMCAFNGDVLLVEKSSDGRVYLLMGDFTGHGLSAAMGTLPVAMVFFKMAEKGVDVNEIASELNSQLKRLLPPSMFFSATLIEFDKSKKLIKVWAGGMPDCYWIGKNGELKGEIVSKHMPLGILKESQFKDETVDYSVDIGDKIYLYSDGIIEAKNNTELFGNERLKQALLSNKANRFEEVLSEFNKFTGDKGQSDDVTLVEFTCADIY